MKKLMIAAAAAAMIGGAYAAPVAGNYLYKFTAVLRTTVGASYDGYATPTQIKLAMNAGRTQFWYQGAEFTTRKDVDILEGAAAAAKAGRNLYYTYVSILGARVPHLALIDANNISDDDRNFLNTLQTNYGTPQLVNGVEIYCCTLAFTAPVSKCYRVVGVDQIVKDVYLTACCAGTFNDATTDAAVITYNSSADQNYGNSNRFTMKRFGGPTYDTAICNEIYARAEAATVSGRQFQGYIAGQGNWIGNSAATAVPYVINGSILGLEAAPQCVTCCTLPVDAIVFDCNSPTEQTTSRKTAAFGTFYIAYNGVQK